MDGGAIALKGDLWFGDSHFESPQVVDTRPETRAGGQPKIQRLYNNSAARALSHLDSGRVDDANLRPAMGVKCRDIGNLNGVFLFLRDVIVVPSSLWIAYRMSRRLV